MDVTKLEDDDGGGIGKDKAKDGLEGEDSKITKDAKDPISIPQGPITRLRSKKLQKALIGYMQDWANQGSSIDHARFNVGLV